MAIMLFLTTFFVTELVVNWSLSSLIGSILSLLMALIYGLQVMDSTLEMFSIGYLRYATLLKVQFESRQKEEQLKANTEEPSVTNPVEEQNDNNRQQNLS